MLLNLIFCVLLQHALYELEFIAYMYMYVYRVSLTQGMAKFWFCRIKDGEAITHVVVQVKEGPLLIVPSNNSRDGE